MASLAVLTLKEPIIPLVSNISIDSLCTTKVINYWTSGAANKKR